MSSKKEISQSVDEAQKLREKLGLKPLRLEEKEEKVGSSKRPAYVDPSVKETSAAEKKEHREKKKQKRVHEELTKGKGIADIVAEEEGAGGASDWVNKMRAKGVEGLKGKAVEKQKDKKRKHSSEDLKGMKVAHAMDDFQEGETEILTLKDSMIIDSDGEVNDGADELHNALRSEKFKSDRANEMKGQKWKIGEDYDPTKAAEYDDDGNIKILGKYDELATEAKGFTLGQQLPDDVDPEVKLKLLMKDDKRYDLGTDFKVQSDFYTTEEMTGFQKRKPMKKKPKKPKVEKDKKRGEEVVPLKGMKPAFAKLEDVDSGEEDAELYDRLHRQRQMTKETEEKEPEEKMLVSGEKNLMTKVVEQVKKMAEEDDPMAGGTDVLGIPVKEDQALTATSQFCNIVQTPLEKMETNKAQAFEGAKLYKEKKNEQRRASGKIDAGIRDLKDVDKEEIEREREMFDEELIDSSTASALQYLRSRSQIGVDQDTHMNRNKANRPLEHGTEGEDDDIYLEHVNQFGRVETPIEAYRKLSWHFHGKMPGKKRKQVRMERLENEIGLKTTLNDRSLPTMEALEKTQKEENKAYVVLSSSTGIK